MANEHCHTDVFLALLEPYGEAELADEVLSDGEPVRVAIRLQRVLEVRLLEVPQAQVAHGPTNARVDLGQHLELSWLHLVCVACLVLAQLERELNRRHAIVIIAITLTVFEWNSIASIAYLIIVFIRRNTEFFKEVLFHVIVNR